MWWIGETIKREAVNASLRATIDNQIITPGDLYCWAQNNIKGVTLFYVPSIEIIEHERKFALESQYSSASAVDGTRSYHCFIPQSNGCLIMKCISVDCYHDKHEFFIWICKMILANLNLESMFIVFMMVSGTLE